MNRPPMESAIVALREQFNGKSARAWRTELHIVERLEQRKRRSSLFRWWIPGLVLGIGSTAWAATEPSLVASAQRWFLPKSSTMAVTAPASSRVATRAMTETAKAPPTHSPTLTEEKPLPSGLLIPPPPLNAAPQSSLPALAPRIAEPENALALYRKAERMQFDEEDCANAVKIWDEYLGADPHGPLVLEARYHRAECLVRLGRLDAARSALMPFAAGEYGSYRRDSAHELLEKMPKP